MKRGSRALHTVFSTIGIVLCVILIPMLVINVTLIVKAVTSQTAPAIGGIVPQIVLTGSMSPEIDSGDLILCQQTSPEEINVGDVISFYDPKSTNHSIVTHRVSTIGVNEDGKKIWKTKGDANNTEDEADVPFENLVAVYKGVKIPKAGNIAIYMQTTKGLICSVLIPLILFVGYDLLRRMIDEKKNKKETDAMMAELEELRAQKTAQNQQPAL